MKKYSLMIYFILTLTNFSSLFGVEENSLLKSKEELIHFFQTNYQKGTIRGEGGLKVNYFKNIPSPSSTPLNSNINTKTALVILPGQGEMAIKYAEFLFDLKNLKVPIFILDHRGQGSSERLLKDREKSHVVYFSDYVNDLKTFYEEVIRPNNFQRTIAFGHSLGGGIALSYALKWDDFSEFILSAPMLDINTAPYSKCIARALLSTLNLIGKGEDYTIGKGPYIEQLPFNAKTSGTGSKPRYDWSVYVNEVIAPQDRIAGGSVTNRWLQEGFYAIDELESSGYKINTPVTIFQAQNDQTVPSLGQNTFCSKAPHCTKIVLENSEHGTIWESDLIRNKVMNYLISRILLN